MYKCVLLVEPLDVVRAGIASIMRQVGIVLHLIETPSVHSAKRSMHGLKPDLVLSDSALIPPPQTLLNELALPASTPVCAIVHKPDPEPLDNAYATSLSIFDSQDVWMSRIRHLKMHQTTTSTLTNREREVLRMLTLGLSNKEVSNVLGISTHTVITHRKNIIEKTDIRSLSGLTLYAIINGLVNIDEIK